MDIIIIGAGIAGAVSAHAFRRDGHRVTVLERDVGPADTAGYRLHLTPAALDAVARALPPDDFRALLANATGGAAFSSFSVLDGLGRQRIRLRGDPASALIGRRPLRTILTRNLEIRWGTTATAVHSSTRPWVEVDGGETIDADLVVIADGTGSPLAGAALGRPTARPSGVHGVAGRLPLDADRRRLVPEALNTGPAFALDPRGGTMFLSLQDLDRLAPLGAPVPGDPVGEDPYLLWSLILDDRDGGPRLSPTAEARQAVASWRGPLRAAVHATPESEIARFRFHVPASLERWPATAVTAIGDAVHPIPPTAGQGASIAILDADDLACALREHADPVTATWSAQQNLLVRARAASAASDQVLRWRGRLRTPILGSLAVRVGLPLASVLSRRRPA